MRPICLIRQPAGMGDILFCQKIGLHFEACGFQVIWPVIPEFAPLERYLGGFQFPTVLQNFPGKKVYEQDPVAIVRTENLLYIPLQRADRLFSRRDEVMVAKYHLVKLTWQDWAEHLQFRRDREQEARLYYDVLGLKEGDRYQLVNRNFASPPDYRVHPEVSCEPDLPIVEMGFLPGFSLFDWCLVIERAAAIHTVETSLNYIVEKLDMAPDVKLVMYSKYQPPYYERIRRLFRKPWRYTGIAEP